jgi:MFS family permease
MDTAVTTTGQRPLAQPAFVISLVIAVVVALGFGLVAPVLPLFADSFGVGVFAVTLVVSAFSGVRLISNLYTGALSDRMGTHRAVGYGVLIVAVSSALCAVAPSYALLVVFRGAGGFGSALFFNSLLSLVVRIVGEDVRGRAVGMLQGAFLVGIAIGPTVGGLLAEPLGLRGPFAIYAGFLAIAGFVALRFLPDPRTTATPPDTRPHVGGDGDVGEVAPARHERGWRQTWRSARQLSADRAFVAALVMMAASRWAATGVRFSLVPIFAADVVGTSEAILGIALTVAALTQMAMIWPAGKVADTFGRRVLAAPAYFLFALIALGLVFATSVPTFLAAMALYGIGTGLTSVTPPAVVADVSPPDQTGVAIGVLNTAGDLGSVLGPMVSGLLVDAVGFGWGFGSSAALLAVGGFVALRMRETLPARATAAV